MEKEFFFWTEDFFFVVFFGFLGFFFGGFWGGSIFSDFRRTGGGRGFDRLIRNSKGVRSNPQNPPSYAPAAGFNFPKILCSFPKNWTKLIFSTLKPILKGQKEVWQVLSLCLMACQSIHYIMSLNCTTCYFFFVRFPKNTICCAILVVKAMLMPILKNPLTYIGPFSCLLKIRRGPRGKGHSTLKKH